ncbi:aminodeoxychorismate synthase component I [Vicingus serpentipes]|uniref:Aminodeoxychorismate synthase component I n=1 Tax=Vicingus serpentipes TaxID=1926625 RepID=A0A5C6RTD8_9FLAO|nr:aminodeoxychorismate synthase component I [Vicingus serpentipes]TXB65205.1 aminodeoxychorismate synthase component I [Vicingus serpentipes]
MESFISRITEREKFQQQVLYYFQEFENVIFLNSNNNDSNLIAVAKTNNLDLKDWQFGFISYDYKNKVEPKLSSKNTCNVSFPEKHFFTPELLFLISENELELFYDDGLYSKLHVSKIIDEIIKVDVKTAVKQNIKITPRISKTSYIEKINKLKRHIQQGDIYEVNFCQEFYAEHVSINPIDIYFKLNEKSPTPFSCYVKHNGNYLLSASPERFIKKEGNKIFSQPIKGTIKRGENKAEDEQLKQELLKDKKERSENIMIVDLVRNDLAKIANKNTVHVDELCGIYTFPQVHQMISTVKAEIKDNTDFNEILKATFPMGSMTGAPKVRAMELIEEYETAKRGLYSGAVGYIDSLGNFDFNVVIRSILYNQKTDYLSFFVGGAITILSDPEKEYEECLLKAKAMFAVLC